METSISLYMYLLGEISIFTGSVCYYCFTISIAVINIAFLLDEFFFFCKPKRVFVINGWCFVWNKSRKHIQNSFAKKKKAKRLWNWGTLAAIRRQKFSAINANYPQDLFWSWCVSIKKMTKFEYSCWLGLY